MSAETSCKASITTRKQSRNALVNCLDPILVIICRCGYATVHDVHDKSLEDRQESFFLSETVKYLYLLFDTDNPINAHERRYVFSTEGHVFPLDGK